MKSITNVEALERMDSQGLCNMYVTANNDLRNELYKMLYRNSIIGSILAYAWDADDKKTIFENLDNISELVYDASRTIKNMKIINSYYYKKTGKVLGRFA